MINLFFSYSHHDEGLRDDLEVHLANLVHSGLIRTWHDRQITAGSDLGQEISEHLESADVILLLMSPHFLASHYCFSVEAKRALEKRESGTAVVIPVILQPCDWPNSPVGKLRATPRDGRPVAMFHNVNEALLQVTTDIRAAAEKLGKSDQVQLGVDAKPLQSAIVLRAPQLAESDGGARNSVIPADSPNPSVEILSVNQITEHRSVPAEVTGTAGEISVIVRVNGGGHTLAAVSVVLRVGEDRVTQTWAVATDDSLRANAGGALLTFGFNTAAFSWRGIPMLRNGVVAITAVVTSVSAPPATATTTHRLANADGVLVTTSFLYSGNDPEAPNGTRIDRGGHEWRRGTITVAATPILYSGRKVSALAITLPGANIPTQLATTEPYVATWSANAAANTVPNVADRKLASLTEFEVDGVTPKGIAPMVAAIDADGFALNLNVLNPPTPFRVDNTRSTT